MTWLPFNVNHYVRVKLTDAGHAILSKGPFPFKPEADEDGYTRWQMWELCAYFGQHMYNSCSVPFETEILIQVEEPKV